MKKKVLVIAASAIIGVLSLYSCQKDPISNNAKTEQPKLLKTSNSIDIEAIKNDPLTHELVSLWMRVKPSQVNKALLDNVLQDNKVDENEYLSVASAMGFASKEDYIQYLEEVYNVTNRLEAKFAIRSLTTDQQNDIFSNVTWNIVTAQGNGASGCAQSFAFCAASVTAAAISGHMACAGTDLFPAVGILCHASVIALQVYGNSECQSSYHDCMNIQYEDSPGVPITRTQQYGIDSYITAAF